MDPQLAGILHDILANRYALTPRLALADWCQDNGLVMESSLLAEEGQLRRYTRNPRQRRIERWRKIIEDWPEGRAAVTAMEYADAHHEAEEQNWEWVWEPEPYVDSGDFPCNCRTPCGLNRKDCPCWPEEVFSCRLVDAEGYTLEALGMIGNPSDDYARQVEAELAIEALARQAV
jgi:hypothetical protein